MSFLKSVKDTPELVFIGTMIAFGASIGVKFPELPLDNHTAPAQSSFNNQSSDKYDGNLSNLSLPAIPQDGYKRLDWASYPQGGSLDERIDWALKKN